MERLEEWIVLGVRAKKVVTSILRLDYMIDLVDRYARYENIGMSISLSSYFTLTISRFSVI